MHEIRLCTFWHSAAIRLAPTCIISRRYENQSGISLQVRRRRAVGDHRISVNTPSLKIAIIPRELFCFRKLQSVFNQTSRIFVQTHAAPTYLSCCHTSLVCMGCTRKEVLRQLILLLSHKKEQGQRLKLNVACKTGLRNSRLAQAESMSGPFAAELSSLPPHAKSL